MQTFLLTIAAVFLMTTLMCLAIMLGVFFGRRRHDRCACAAAKRVARLIEQRNRQERAARNYSPQTVDPNHLPVIELPEKH